MDRFDRRAARRLAELRRAKERCSHAIGPVPCPTCGARVCLVCQPTHRCQEPKP